MAKGTYLLGVDIGTSGSKGVLVDLHGKVVAHESCEHGVDTPKPGWFEHDADKIWWADLVKITQALIAQSGADAKEIAAVGVSALCPEMLPVDSDGRPLRKAILYCDCRAQKQIDEINRRLGEERIVDTAVNALSTHYIGPKILWFRENEPSLFNRTHRVFSGVSYLVFKLTGAFVVDYVEAKDYSPLFNVEQKDWDKAICQELGISRELLPDTQWATDVAGTVTAQAAKETGLAQGTPVITGTCDSFAEGLSVGAVEEGDASLLYGTTMGMGLVLDHLVRHPAMFTGPGAIPNTYQIGFATSSSGALTTWFRDNFGQVERAAEAKLGISAYSLLSDQASEIRPGSEGLVVLPYFAGERSPINDSQARGLVIGLTLSHTRRHIYRALLEGIAYSLRHNLDILEGTGAEIRRIIATGGGTRSRLWPQIVSDVTGRDQDIAVQPYGSPYGDAFMAGYGAGVFKDLSPLREGWAPSTTRISHAPEKKSLYDRYYAVYLDLYEQNKAHMHQLADLSISG
jgi:xylulokinase